LRVRRSLLNFGTSVLLVAVTALVALKSTPWLVKWLGEGPFGGYRVVFDGYGYLTLLELGLGGALGPLLARALQRQEDDGGGELRRVVAAGARAYFWVALGTVAAGLAVTPFVHRFARGLNGPMVVDLRRAWVVGLASFLALALVPARTVVEARQRGYVVNLLLTAQSLLITGLSLALAYRGWGITGQALAQVAGVWAFALALAAVAARSHPGLWRAAVTGAGAADPEARRALRKLSAPTLLLNVSGRVSVLSDNLVVGGLLGAERVTALFNTQRLVALGQTVLQGVGNASWAALAELHARGDRETFGRRLVEMTRIVAVLAAVGFVPVVAFNRAFVRLWLGPEFAYGGDPVVAVAVLVAVLLAVQSLWAWCFTATGKARELVAPAAAAAALNLAASVVLTRRLGIVGPLLGSALALGTVSLGSLLWRLDRTFGVPAGPLLRALGVPTAAGAASASVLWWLTRRLGHEPAGWPGLAAAMGLSALAMLGLSVAFLLTPSDRALWRTRLAGLCPRPAARERREVEHAKGP
jgi:O-antigen/teichoic acid export membrane protein